MRLFGFFGKHPAKSYGLALGGGSARGLGHIGVIRYLEEQNIQIHAVAGTSMGALIAALFAKWLSSYEMEKIAKECSMLSLLDFDLKNGIVKGKKVVSFFEELFGEMKIEDLPIPLRIVATDIDTGEKIVFTRGSVIEALRASVSIPWVFAPHRFEGRDLVDGGLVENLPVEELPDGKVIAVSAHPFTHVPILKKEATEKSLFFPDGHLFGNSYEILRKTIAIMIRENEQRSLASREGVLLIHPDCGRLGYSDFGKVDEFIQYGYKEAKKIFEKQ